jgi:hypothetical protein
VRLIWPALAMLTSIECCVLVRPAGLSIASYNAEIFLAVRRSWAHAQGPNADAVCQGCLMPRVDMRVITRIYFEFVNPQCGEVEI